MAKFRLTNRNDLFPDLLDNGKFQDNSGNDNITARNGDDVVDGGEGNDTINGGNGNDFLFSFFGNNRILGGEGYDEITSGEGNDKLFGNAGSDFINAGDGDDRLNGGRGNDRLYGEAGNDTIRGGRGSDFLDGGLGGDRMIGERGNDTYYVDSEDDSVIEMNNQGDDLVVSYLESYTLPDYVENLLLDRHSSTGSYAIEGLGNERDNIIQGNVAANLIEGDDGDDTIEGAAGNDTLTGGNGEDSFLYRDLNYNYFFDRRNFGVDTITDFNKNQDKILLDENIFFYDPFYDPYDPFYDPYDPFYDSDDPFYDSDDPFYDSDDPFYDPYEFPDTDIGDEFEIVNNIDDARESDALIVYNKDKGVIYYNQNRSDPGFADNSRAGGAFIVLEGAPKITEDNFELVFSFDIPDLRF